MKYGHQVAPARSCTPILLTGQLLFLLERPQYTLEVKEILSSSSRLSHHVVRDNTITSDLARLEFWRGMTGEGFWEAYQDYVPVSASYPERGINWRPNLRANLDSSRSRRPESVRPSWRPCRIPGGDRLRFRPREHADWNVPPLDQR